VGAGEGIRKKKKKGEEGNGTAEENWEGTSRVETLIRRKKLAEKEILKRPRT